MTGTSQRLLYGRAQILHKFASECVTGWDGSYNVSEKWILKYPRKIAFKLSEVENEGSKFRASGPTAIGCKFEDQGLGRRIQGLELRVSAYQREAWSPCEPPHPSLQTGATRNKRSS